MSSIPMPQGSLPTDSPSKNTKGFISRVSLRSDEESKPPMSKWKPNAFRLPPLLAAIFTSWALIIVLQILLVKSQREGGIIIADTIDDIPLGKSFLYRYLPTIVALIFSIFWGWIDLQVKRLEPYHQLSKRGGASGKDSLLLSYPFDFLPFVPFSAFRRKHWAVFWAGTSIMLVTWGIVPIQAGIFSTETIRLSSEAMFAQSTGYLPGSEQNEDMDSQYIYSTHGIIWLNESLPPFMTRDYALAPFRPLEADVTVNHENQTWTSSTTLYSLDIDCEVPGVEFEDEGVPTWQGETITLTQMPKWASSNGCKFPASYYKSVGNETMGPNPDMNNMADYDTKEFASIYIGQYPTDYADYYLQSYCPVTANHTFMAFFTKNKMRDDDPPNEVTRLYCTPSYYEQKVNATVNARTKAPISYTVLGDKQALPLEKWNSTFFEPQMNTGKANEFNRKISLPLTLWPDQRETLASYPVSLGTGGTVLQPLAGFAIGANQGPLEALLDPAALAGAYQSAYRIIFARSMVQILDQEFATTSNELGHYDYVAAAIVVVPVFTYIVEALLGLVSVCGLVLIWISWRRTWGLHSDPATIASIQSLVADNASLLREFSVLDKANKEELETNLKDKKFKLSCDEKSSLVTNTESTNALSESLHGPVLCYSEESQQAKPVRPKEFRLFAVLPFVLLQIALAIALGVLLRQSQPFGIVRPSKSPIIRQIVENYIPTALATLIEPIWILINRLLCMLQPLDELRGGHAVASRSIDADYSSLPPQLVIFKALKSSHFKLATACTMALLANFLAVAFSGMFDERSISVPRMQQLSPPYQAKFVDVNGTVSADMNSVLKFNQNFVPSGAYRGGAGTNQFLVAESNYSAGNPLPAWTDNEFMYIPFMNETEYEGSEAVQAQTFAFGSTLECNVIPETSYDVVLTSDAQSSVSSANVSITMLNNQTNNHVTCSRQYDLKRGPAPLLGLPPKCDDGKLGFELVMKMNSLKNATREERDFCQQTAFMAYVRAKHDWCVFERNHTDVRLNNSNAMLVGCRPNLVAGQAKVRVNSNGRVEDVRELDVSSSLSPDFYQQHFTNGTAGATTAGGANELIAQAHGYLFSFSGRQYHNDSVAADMLNYFMVKQSNDSRLLDPEAPLPTLQDITDKLYPVYRKLFAIWLGINKDKLLVPHTDSSTMVIEGQTHDAQIRIFLSKPLFVMAEIILGIYVLAAICIYLWRPGKFLPRMPTSIAAVIALFAASEAVEDMRGTALFTRRQRRQHLANIGAMYGYGTFVGADGLTHEGIEKEPLVTAVPLPGVMEKVQTRFSQKSLGIRRGN